MYQNIALLSTPVTSCNHQSVSEWEKVMEARFVLVARDALVQKSCRINPLKAETEEEATLMEQGQKRSEGRKKQARDSLFKHAPSETEKELIHEFFIKTVDHAALR